MASNEPAWNPAEADVTPVRGRHRLPKQRAMSRSSVLGVATIAAVGVGGVATAQGNSPVPISMPDVKVPDFAELSGIGGGDSAAAENNRDSTPESAVSEVTDAGELLRTRILEQAAQQRAAAETDDRRDAERDAADAAAREAAAKKVREAAAKMAADKKAAEKAAADRKAREAAERKAAANRFVAPTANYSLTASFGQSGANWSADHTGLDFAAPTGTAVVSVGAGEITSAGWAGSYGYRVIVTHADGTETWYCHLSSMVQTSGKVAAGGTIGRVGATGNATGPHLHLEVRPGGGDPVDPAAWLRSKGVTL